MYRAVIDADGRLPLGLQALGKGYRPGQVVDVIVTCADSLIVRLVDDVTALDVAYRPVPSEAERPALRAVTEV